MEIERKVYIQIVEEAKAHSPLECCGYLAGVGTTVSRAYPMNNIDQSREHFSFDPAEQFTTVKRIRKENLKVLAVYHSHPETPARPSGEDIRLAFDPDISHVIVSLIGEQPAVRSFQIRNGLVKLEELTIV
ncbi:MAG: Mov34/MPN/PAD-1 family protein [Desulfobulbaceae bacterium BRH_c16a]|nr:MAG: Mov34/MPN/PAD-1 family protein [Desulfobulbaceae bacterium BRH_c16a]